MSYIRYRINIFEEAKTIHDIVKCDFIDCDESIFKEYYLFMEPKTFIESPYFNEEDFMDILMHHKGEFFPIQSSALYTHKSLSKRVLLKLSKKSSLSHIILFDNCDLDVILENNNFERSKNYIMQKVSFGMSDIYRLSNIVPISTIIAHQQVTMDFIRSNIESINLNKLARQQVLDEDFINEYIDKLDFRNIIEYQNVSDEFINRHINRYIKYIRSKLKSVDSIANKSNRVDF